MWSGEACSALGAWPHPCHTVSRSTREIAQAVRRDVDAGAEPQLHTHSEKQEKSL